jgi:HD superfamily phosphohydrolase
MLAERLDLSEDERRRIRLAALVHDLGHGPFSHVSEEIMRGHEQISAAVLRHDDGLKSVIEESDREYIAALLTESGEGKQRSLARDIIAGPADADKFDYLLRDSYFCGVKYGEYDLHKIVESARAVPEFGDKTALGFHEDAIYALEEMVLARHHMHRQVYGHKTRLATDRMLVRAMRLGLEEGDLPTDVFSISSDEELDAGFVSRFVEWDDGRVIRTLCSAEGHAGAEVMQSLLDRRLFKRVIRLDGDDLRERCGGGLSGFAAVPSKDILKDNLSEVEASIAAAAGVDPHWVALYWENIKNPIANLQSVAIDDKEIVLLSDDDEARKFIDASDIFENAELPPKHFVSLFIRPNDPADYPFNEEISERINEALNEGLVRIATAQASL